MKMETLVLKKLRKRDNGMQCVIVEWILGFLKKEKDSYHGYFWVD